MTMESEREFESIRQDPDPIRRGRRATALLTLYQQRATELARLRRAAIEEAHSMAGMSYTEIASALGITKGRITQIRNAAPQPERALFGVGPVSVGVPYRYRTTDRERPLIAAEDAQTGEQLERLLSSLAFAVNRYQIEPDRTTAPDGDTIVICGPKSAPIGAELLAHDPVLHMIEHAGRWWIEHRETGERIGSPTDDSPSQPADIAYISRHREDTRVIIHIAGIHAIGSLSAAQYLTAQAAELFRMVGDKSFSLAVQGEYVGLTVSASRLIAGPYIW